MSIVPTKPGRPSLIRRDEPVCLIPPSRELLHAMERWAEGEPIGLMSPALVAEAVLRHHTLALWLVPGKYPAALCWLQAFSKSATRWGTPADEQAAAMAFKGI